MRFRRAGLGARCAGVAAALLGSLSAQTNITTPVAADSSVAVTLSGLRLDRATNTYDSVVTVTNTSAAAIGGPFYLAVSGIDVPTVTFANSAGKLPNQLPYIALTVGQLMPNTPVAGGTLKFRDPHNVVFRVNTAVWDATSVTQFGGADNVLSCAGVVPGSDGTIRLTNTGAGPALYVPPVDNAGRTAACTPAPGAWLPLGDTFVQCKTSGGAAPPAACSFDYPVTPQIVLYPNGAADLTLTPCNPIVPAAPGLPPAGTASNGLIPIVIDYVPACVFAPPGNATFLIVNNGPNVAFNVTLSLGVPAGYTNYAMQFDTPARCTKATALVMPNGQPYPGADVLNCFFSATSSGQTITATVGVDLPSSNNISAVPSLYAQVAVDPTQNIDPDLTNNSIFFQPSFPHTIEWPTMPAAASCVHDPSDHTFEVLQRHVRRSQHCGANRHRGFPGRRHPHRWGRRDSAGGRHPQPDQLHFQCRRGGQRDQMNGGRAGDTLLFSPPSPSRPAATWGRIEIRPFRRLRWRRSCGAMSAPLAGQLPVLSGREALTLRQSGHVVGWKEGIVKTSLVLIPALFLLAATAPGQPQSTFEVASIKTAPPYTMEMVHSGKVKLGMKVDGARVEFGATALTELIARAYRVRTFQISGPGWMSDERYDIVAKLPDGSTPDQIPEMLQSLLAERFKLRTHRDTKEYGVYALVTAKDGMKLTSRPKDYDPNARNGVRPMTLDAYADMLSRAVDLPVVDMTGLQGEYLVALGPIMQEMGRQMRVKEAGTAAGGPAAGPDSSRGAFDIVEDLGLKLESRKLPLPHVLIDHVEKTATEN